MPPESFTPRELDVMSILWDLGSATVSDVQGRLSDPLAYTTVLSVLRTLTEKGYVRHEAEGRAYRYFALVDWTAAGRRELRRLVKKGFACLAIDNEDSASGDSTADQQVCHRELHELAVGRDQVSRSSSQIPPSSFQQQRFGRRQQLVSEPALRQPSAQSRGSTVQNLRKMLFLELVKNDHLVEPSHQIAAKLLVGPLVTEFVEPFRLLVLLPLLGTGETDPGTLVEDLPRAKAAGHEQQAVAETPTSAFGEHDLTRLQCRGQRLGDLLGPALEVLDSDDREWGRLEYRPLVAHSRPCEQRRQLDGKRHPRIAVTELTAIGDHHSPLVTVEDSGQCLYEVRLTRAGGSYEHVGAQGSFPRSQATDDPCHSPDHAVDRPGLADDFTLQFGFD